MLLLIGLIIRNMDSQGHSTGLLIGRLNLPIHITFNTNTPIIIMLHTICLYLPHIPYSFYLAPSNLPHTPYHPLISVTPPWSCPIFLWYILPHPFVSCNIPGLPPQFHHAMYCQFLPPLSCSNSCRSNMFSRYSLMKSMISGGK